MSTHQERRRQRAAGLRQGPIDVHAHAVIESTFGTAGDLGPRLLELPDGSQEYHVGGYTLCGVRYRGSVFMDPDLRVQRMDQLGIAAEVLSPNPLTYFSHVDAASAASFARRHNDALAEIVDARPDRLLGVAQIPVQDPDLACAELQRAVQELGLLGPYFGSEPGHAPSTTRRSTSSGRPAWSSTCRPSSTPRCRGSTRPSAIRASSAGIWS